MMVLRGHGAPPRLPFHGWWCLEGIGPHSGSTDSTRTMKRPSASIRPAHPERSRASYVLFLDDWHAADVLFIQGLSRALGETIPIPAPIIMHGSGEHADRLLATHGVSRTRRDGVLQVASAVEHALVEQALCSVNRKIVNRFTDAMVPAVGVIGSRCGFEMRKGGLHVLGVRRLLDLAVQGVVTVVAASAREAPGGATGEIGLAYATRALVGALEPLMQAAGVPPSADVTDGSRRRRSSSSAAGAPPSAGTLPSPSVTVVFFSKEVPPGGIRQGSPPQWIHVDDPVLRECVPDWEALVEMVQAGIPVLLAHAARLTRAGNVVGVRIVAHVGSDP